MESKWTCPKCGRAFKRDNQRHACGTGDRAGVLRNRPDNLVKVYDAIEKYAKSLGDIEVVARERYVLLRSSRIFTDLVIMTDAVRVAVHLGRKVDDPIFSKIVKDKRHVTHVVKLQEPKDVRSIKRYVKEAYDFSLEQPAKKLQA